MAVFGNMKDWVLAKEKTKRLIEREDVSPYMHLQYERLNDYLDTVKPHNEDADQ